MRSQHGVCLPPRGLFAKGQEYGQHPMLYDPPLLPPLQAPVFCLQAKGERQWLLGGQARRAAPWGAGQTSRFLSHHIHHQSYQCNVDTGSFASGRRDEGTSDSPFQLLQKAGRSV